MAFVLLLAPQPERAMRIVLASSSTCGRVALGKDVAQRPFPYRFGQGTVGSTVTFSPLRNVNSTLPVKPPFGQVFGTVP
jgi:hypothetical protein